ncbi:MAG: T9SS type A sorting domain-containing protein [Melioribacter sp.]|nr:T9SS type A sorting domain-containing protein [Melioribacter sp.]
MFYRITFILVLIFQGLILSQIPNNSFEEWVDGNPVGWFSSNRLFLNTIITITPTNISNSGLKAVKGEVIQTPILFAPFLILGNEGTGIPYAQRPAMLTGYYQFFPQGGDRLQILAGLFKGGFSLSGNSLLIKGKLIGYGILNINNEAREYTLFRLPIVYSSNENPDTCGILVRIIGQSTDNDYHAGSYFLLDDLEFTNISNINEKEILSNNFELLQNYPNPFNSTTKISYKIPEDGHVNLKVYDILGKEVATLVNEKKHAGTHFINFDATDLISGVYIYTVYYNGYSKSKKMLLTK